MKNTVTQWFDNKQPPLYEGWYEVIPDPNTPYWSPIKHKKISKAYYVPPTRYAWGVMEGFMHIWYIGVLGISLRNIDILRWRGVSTRGPSAPLIKDCGGCPGGYIILNKPTPESISAINRVRKVFERANAMPGMKKEELEDLIATGYMLETDDIA